MLQSLDGAFYRRLTVTAAALAVYRLGVLLPVPGLVPETVAAAFKPGDLAVRSISIFALGIMPLLTVLILAELVKIFFPSLRPLGASQRRQSRSPPSHGHRARAVNGSGAGSRPRQWPSRASPALSTSPAPISVLPAP